MIRRPRRTVPAVLVALAGLAAAVLAAVSCVQILLGRPPLLPLAAVAAAGAAVSASSPAVIAAASAVAVLGLVLLLCAVLPGRPVVLDVGDDGLGIATGLDRRSLDRALTHAAARVDGVDRADVTSRSRTVTAAVRTAVGDTPALRAQVADAVTERLTDLSPGRSPRVRVAVTTVRNP